jgi:hypothetical protein
MLHVATVHYKSPRWIEIQARHLRDHIAVPFQTWTSLEEIDPAYGVHFDHVIEQRGEHAGKLNHLAIEISGEAAEDDLIMFLDGDAFPIADPMPTITRGLANASMVAVRRSENLMEPQPHPCFTVTTVGTWRSLPGDWSAGFTWPGPRGGPRSDVGGNLLRTLELTKTPWVELLRSNRTNLDPIYFAIYGGILYHHGAGFRAGDPSGVHRTTQAPAPLRVPSIPGLGRVMAAVNGRRLRAWARRTQAGRIELSNEVFDEIQAGGSGWLAKLM